MSTEKFCLRWNDFENNISSAFRELRDDKDFFDVTLACDDEQLQAHKVILSACSPFFGHCEASGGLLSDAESPLSHLAM
jgi:hypothetical protein